MSRDVMPTEFRAKTWIYRVLAIIFGSLALFSATLGPLFLFGVMKDAKGAPATDAGIALCAMSVPFLLMFALAVFSLRARRRPVLRLCREGIEIVRIGSSSLDGIPLIPGLVRVVWLILSTQGFRRNLVCFPWESFQDAYVSGLPMVRQLTILASHSRPDDQVYPRNSFRAEQIVLEEAAFSAPLDQIAQAIKWYANSSQPLIDLPSWHTNHAPAA